MKITLFNSENIKIIVVILIIGIIFVYLVCKKKKRVERFYNIDKNILCIKYNDVEEIKNFRLNMGYEISPENIKSNIIKLDEGQPIEEGKNTPINYRYDFIQIEVNTLEKRKDDFVISPTGIIFDPTNDDIIVFDIYKLRRFQYRLNRSKFDMSKEDDINKLFDIRNNKNLVSENNKNYNPRNIEILSEFEKKRKLLYIQVLIYLNEILNDGLKKQLLLLYDPESIIQDNYIEKNTDLKLIEILDKINFTKEISDNPNSEQKIYTKIDNNLVNNLENDHIFIDNSKILTGYIDGSVPITKGGLLSEIMKNIDFFYKYQKLKECRNNAMLPNSDPSRYSCSIKYQEDLPKYNLGEQGKGIESLNYDKELKAPLFNNKMNPLSNSWREPRYNGVFEPIKSYRDKRVYNQKTRKGVKIKDSNTPEGKYVENIGFKGVLLKSDKDKNSHNKNYLVNNEKKGKSTYNKGKNLLFEPFYNNPSPKLVPGLPTIGINKEGLSNGYFVLPDELDAVGVKMCFYNLDNNNFIFVPDVLNNRVQIFSVERGSEFSYKGQFGNLEYTSHRSLPTYQGEKVIDIFEPLKNTSIMYEPIHNMELFEQDIMRESPTRCVKTCDYENGNYNGNKNINKFFNKKDNTINSENQCYSELKNKLFSQGPEEIRFSDSSSYGLNFDNYYTLFLENLEKQKKENEKKEGTKDNIDNKYTLFEENVEECVTDFSTRRANIHHRQYELNSNNDLVPIKRGHFYSLYNEYVRVRAYLKRDDIKESVYSNPFNLVDGAELCMGKFSENCTKSKDPYDGVEGCSLAYRRFLLKIIKETNEGQKFGQLFRPKSITYDSEADLFYVADTYHHCIQCYRLRRKSSDEKYKPGTELVFESVDKDFNESSLYCYNKDWDYNLGYHSTPVYSLGLRQQILEIDEQQRNSDLNKGASVFPSVDLEGSYPIPESKVEDEWVKKYAESDGKVRLYRWVSGSSKYGNYVYDNDRNIDYNKIGKIKKNGTRNNQDYFFYTSLVKKDLRENEEDDQHEKEAINNPGVGEFLYPSDIVFVKREISPVKNNDLLLVADTGNNRVSIFKKYFLNIDTTDKYRFRFYRFLGDRDSPENRKLVNPIGIALSPVNGSIYVLQGNMFDYNSGIYQTKQSIKVFIPKRIEEEGYYKYSHTISLEQFKTNLGPKDPRFTKIEVDNRGIILLTDINNNRVQILKETINSCNVPDCLLKLTKVNSNLLNKVVFEVKYNPHQGINQIYDPFMDKYLKSFNRFRIIIERFNISTGKKTADILLSKEYNHNYFDTIENQNRDLFIYEDKYESLPRESGYWYVNTNEGQVLIDNSENINSSNFLDTKIVRKKNFYNNLLSEGIEDWQGKSMTPNTSYKYILHLFNYHSIINIKSDSKEVIEINTHPLNIPSKNISISNIVTKNENYLNIFIDYLSISKLHKETIKYNPLCVYILRRNHNRTRDGLLRYINLFRHNIIQLFVPNASKYIYNNFSKPKFGKLYLYDITQASSPLEMTSENLLLPSNTNKYQDSKYIILYSAEGGMIDENGKILPSSDVLGLDYVEDFFTLGDDPKTPHTKIKYHVKIDIRQTHKRAIMISDNSTLESNLLYYKKNRFEKDENSLDLVKKYPIAQLVSEGYKNKPVEFQDKGYIKDGIKIPLPLNKTLEYSIFVANQYKINPSCTTLYYTTRPEKPYIKKISKVEVTEGGEKVSKIKIEWYYTQNRNLYWPVNFMILRLPLEDEGPSIPVITHKLDFTQGSPHENDKYFNIESSLVTVKGDGEYIFEKTFNLDGQRTWEVKFIKFNNKKEPGFKDIFINGKKFIWSPNNTSYIFTNSFLTINMKLNAKEDEYLNQIIVTEFIEVETEGPSISGNQLLLSDIINNESEQAERNIQELKDDSEKLKQKYLKQLDSEYNDKFIQAVEAYRKRNQIGFYFNLQDDYNGYYRSVVDNYSGNSGQLLVYLQALTDNDLLEIFDELHDKIKIYHGDATMTIDGPNGMLRSGGRDAMIEKIRHLSFMIKEATKSENKSLGITCMEQDFNDIFNQSGFQGVTQCLSEEKAKKLEDLNQNTPIASPEKLSVAKLEELTSNFEIEMETDFISLDAKEVSGENLQSVLKKFNFGGDWEQNGINNIVYDLERNTAKLIKEKVSFNTNNKLGNKDTILLWRKGEKNISEGPSISTSVSRNIKPYQVLKQGQPIKQLGSFMSEEDRQEVLLNYAIPPTPVSLSAEKDIPATIVFNNPKLDEYHLYSTHIQYLPADLDKQYSYKIGCFQNGHSLNSTEKKNYLGIVSNSVGSELGMGEVYSEEAVIGRKTNITKVENEISTVSDLVAPVEPPETIMPIIKYFEPKEGTEDTIIRIVGSKLEELEYIAMRDVKLKVLKKQKRIIEENGEKVTYDEFLVKPPTLKQLERECWQSYETYKTLVWGYYSGTGKQIVSSEVGSDNKMYKYLVRSICPDQQLRKYAPSI